MAVWSLGNNSVCTQYAALAGVIAIILEWSVLCKARRSMSICRNSPFLQGISPGSSVQTLLGSKHSKKKHYSCGHAFCRVCEFSHFGARRNAIQSYTSVLSAVVLQIEEWRWKGEGLEGRKGILPGGKEISRKGIWSSLIPSQIEGVVGVLTQICLSVIFQAWFF